ncbi:MAG: methylated-DNA--[protein]-cysteine S-methyltransferase [Tatlockia sp.]|nr:methylated-DNA--[protein]-cysteine S-methyltransferase [Tatlockia sp.]
MLVVRSFKTSAGWLEIQFDEHYIYRAKFTQTPVENKENTHLTALIEQELDSYFRNPHHRFQLPLKSHGTAYQQRVWNALLVIPVGRTVTYGDLAKTLQSSPRAIGQACKTNPLALFVPCHRVVGKNNLGGYMGRTDDICFKTNLLEHESSFSALDLD